MRIVGAPASRGAALDRVREVVQQTNGKVLSAFSLADLEQLSAREGITLRALLEELRAAGLELVAEAPFDRLQDPRRSIEEVNIAGLALARLTIHQSPADRVAVLKAVAELQRAVAVVRAFAPLPRRVNPAAPTTGYDDVKHVALARLVVDNVPSIQVDWSLYGPKLAQVALTVGADDVDAVSPEDETTEGRRRAPLEEIRRNIRAAGQEPVERNGRFEPFFGPRDEPLRMSARSERDGPRASGRRRLPERPSVGLRSRPGARFDLRYDVPSECARLLHAGAIDVGLIPSIEYLRGGPYRIVPDLAIASRGPVASVAIYTTKPMADVRSIALDTSSRTSVALVSVLCARLFKIAPALERRGPDLSRCSSTATRRSSLATTRCCSMTASLSSLGSQQTQQSAD